MLIKTNGPVALAQLLKFDANETMKINKQTNKCTSNVFYLYLFFISLFRIGWFVSVAYLAAANLA